MALDKKDTPLRRDTFALAGVLMHSLEPCPRYQPLIERLSNRSLDLLEAITQALAGIDRYERLTDADSALQSLRSLLRLAGELDILSNNDLIDFLEQADRVGRQIGGWLRQLTRPG